MTNDEIKKMILIEVHRMIQEAATNGVGKLGQTFNQDAVGDPEVVSVDH